MAKPYGLRWDGEQQPIFQQDFPGCMKAIVPLHGTTEDHSYFEIGDFTIDQTGSKAEEKVIEPSRQSPMQPGLHPGCMKVAGASYKKWEPSAFF
ncbi:hypothetical protein [Desulfatirhabdium butyrativorans]|uniref:hypothetical protein n=1 Tax=Desulfatirhabdium butyrativorans TaxID=340467 RepID=UPI001B7FCDFD|nr:hypothetical protein [Desulfatirhabdium butyrativorans]